MKSLKVKLAALSFLNFAIWGSYLISLGIYLNSIGLGNRIFWFYTAQGLVSIIMPAAIGIVADRYLSAQKVLSLCHLTSGTFMGFAATYCAISSAPSFGILFTLYALSLAFFMPTIGLMNSVAYTALNKAGLDTVKHFPPIRVFGTVGFIVAMLMVNFISIDGISMQSTYWQLYLSAAFSLITCVYALTMPDCPPSRAKGGSLSEALGLQAFSLFRTRTMATFFIFSFMLGVSLQITNSYGSTFINSFGLIKEFASTWGAQNATALISLSQISETLCILLIPFCLRRFGIKYVMLMAMFAWVARFGLFAFGNPGSGVWMFILSMIVYGIAFDFFNISGSLYVDQQTDKSMRSSAQGLFMLMTNGLGATIGTMAAGAVANHFVFDRPAGMDQIHGWSTSWLIFAGYALVVAILFWIFFRSPRADKVNTTDNKACKIDEAAEGGIAGSEI